MNWSVHSREVTISPSTSSNVINDQLKVDDDSRDATHSSYGRGRNPCCPAKFSICAACAARRLASSSAPRWITTPAGGSGATTAEVWSIRIRWYVVFDSETVARKEGPPRIVLTVDTGGDGDLGMPVRPAYLRTAHQAPVERPRRCSPGSRVTMSRPRMLRSPRPETLP